MVTSSRHQGFSLVEIAIALVLIGLFIGGVLKSQEMLTNAKVSRVETDLRNIPAAILAYRERYGFLPGDDPAAATRFPGHWTAADNGNGNGVITGEWNSSDNALESRKIWKHLRGAGLLKGPADGTGAAYQQPAHAFGGFIGIQQNLHNVAGSVVVFGALPGKVAQIMEVRTDDGAANAGAIQGHASQAGYVVTGSYDVAFAF
ncbi:MAG: prepilin-type N-terminal cleavage/methylation domain-containing protein [Gammaproteobacteria bacterium]|nr:prepilin-type N-terminal cleavage/methylation domain-containing protein [Gammaproteobacteria bacterium]